MKIYKIQMRKEDLTSIPANERVFLIYAGHALNELNVLCRMIIFAMPVRRGEAERQFMVIQNMMLMRGLAGKLHEMWVLFNRTYYKSKLAVTLLGQIDEDAELALKQLKVYFNTQAVSISTVRHKHAFHYDVAQVDAGLAKLHPKATLDIYFDHTSANTIWGFADSVINSAVMVVIDSESHKSAFETLMNDTQEMAKSFQLVLEAIMGKIISERLAHRFTPENVDSETVRSTNWKKIELPTFVEEPSPWSVTLSNEKVLEWAGQRLAGPEFLTSLIQD
ncbi:MAG: hypothetical protein EOO64_01780 [Massilia sp.]|nr:MAG: hypothetical protein EOO64_01780 [Massilia sp.]